MDLKNKNAYIQLRIALWRLNGDEKAREEFARCYVDNNKGRASIAEAIKTMLGCYEEANQDKFPVILRVGDDTISLSPIGNKRGMAPTCQNRNHNR